GCWGFWTAESGGPRFLIELAIEFSAGAFFPLDVLPRAIQAFLQRWPSPYLVFFPLHVFLEKVSRQELMVGFATQGCWILIIAGLCQWVWQRGIRIYESVGS